MKDSRRTGGPDPADGRTPGAGIAAPPAPGEGRAGCSGQRREPPAGLIPSPGGDSKSLSLKNGA